MPGLRSKAFTVDRATNEATNGVPPSIRFVQIAELVDNAH
jgi:hypothetical protein